MADYSYMGSGKIYLREYSADAGLIEVGNVSALTFSVSEDVKELKDYTTPGGGTYNEVRRIQSVEMSMTMHDLSAANLARALFGAATNVGSGTVTAEAVEAYKGSLVVLAKLPSSITTVTSNPVGTTFDAGDDYILTGAGLYIPATSAINNPQAILVTYQSREFDALQALVNAAKEYEVVFDGLNEARSGKPVVVEGFRVKIGAAQSVSLIGDDFAALEVSGKLLKDTLKSGAGISQYFKVRVAA